MSRDAEFHRWKSAFAPTHLMPKLRIIFSLDYDLTCCSTNKAAQLIAPLDRFGMSPYIRPIGKQRVIALRVGDRLQHAENTYIVRGVRAYRENYTDTIKTGTRDGYIVRPSR